MNKLLIPLAMLSIVAQTWSPAVFGQGPPDRLANVDALLDRQTGRIQTEVADRVQQRVLDRAVESSDAVANQVTERGLPLNRLGERLSQRVGDRIPERVREVLPERLPVLDRRGDLAFVEIHIEPNIRVVEFEWVMLVTLDQRERLRAEAPELMQYLAHTKPVNAIGGFLLSFMVPPDLDANTHALLARVPEDLRHLIDRNHIYALQRGAPETLPEASTKVPLELPMASVCSDPVAVGMIDSALNLNHSAFDNTREGIAHKNFIARDMTQPTGHGTAVASLLVGQGPDLKPLVPGATIFSASVIYATQTARHQGTTVMQLLEALDWLIGREVAVINMSLTGPANRLLEAAVNIAAAKGVAIVAAAGNEGPHAPPQYPAAYASVLAVTAVAQDGSVYRWANQGPHIDFAALGVALPTALGDGGFGLQSGTSLATPVVTAFMACAIAALLPEDLHLQSPEQQLQMRIGAMATARVHLQAQAVDLGEGGRDPVFGYGLLHPMGQH